ncbi:MAG TPA: hypothetical protein VK028_10240 [Micromonosporaceae bacterium]|nr:hypothetical protein [Micromonosporaceae bacterium]
MNTNRTRTWVIAMMIVAGICAIPAVIAALLIFPGDGDPESAPPTSPPSSSPVASEASEASEAIEAAERDVTGAFLDHVLLDVVRTPSWLDTIERVYWTGSGELWAQTSLSPDTDPAGADVRSICGLLSRFVAWNEGGQWAAVSVRASDGSELLGRHKPEDTCNPK